MDEQNYRPVLEGAELFSFKAETKQVLNILIHSLYKDKEVFLRELLSNSSDALNRLRFELLTNQDILDPDVELRVKISVDKNTKTITIQDSGIGMNRAEIVENLGTIAQSGARKFIEAVKEQNGNFTQVIGQFGVGFYSVFMVAEWVKVSSRSYRTGDRAVTWYATGEDNYELVQSDKADRGTTIEIKLKAEAAEFADEFKIKEIIRKHSDYIGFPIYVGDDTNQVNKQNAIWRKSKQDVSEEQYKDLYKQLTLDFEEPLIQIHSITDAPVQFYTILYVPQSSERAVFSLRREDGLKLYSRNILIDEYSKDLLPEYLRFIQGVVDSEDLPLNVSRETVQSTNIISRLKKILTGQVLKELENVSNNDPVKYLSFWKEFGVFLKQGIATSQPDSEKLSSLMRFKTNKQPEVWSSLDDYVGRMTSQQKAIYFILGDDQKSALRSPHLDYFSSQGMEVLLLTDPIDSFMLMGLHKYKDFELKNVAQVNVDEENKSDTAKDAVENIDESELDALILRFKQVLGDQVTDVRASNHLSHSVARLVDPEGSPNQEMQRVYKYLGKEVESTKKILELNPAHPLLKSLHKLNLESALGKKIIEQIYDSALLIEGLHPDPSSMVSRVEEIIQAAISNQ